MHRGERRVAWLNVPQAAEGVTKGQVEELMRRGDEARGAGQYAAAASLYSEVLEMKGGNMEAYLKRSHVHCLQHDHKSALSDVNKALRIDGRNVEVPHDTHLQLRCA